MGYGPWGRTEPNTNERLHFHHLDKTDHELIKKKKKKKRWDFHSTLLRIPYEH